MSRRRQVSTDRHTPVNHLLRVLHELTCFPRTRGFSATADSFAAGCRKADLRLVDSALVAQLPITRGWNIGSDVQHSFMIGRRSVRVSVLLPAFFFQLGSQVFDGHVQGAYLLY